MYFLVQMWLSYSITLPLQTTPSSCKVRQKKIIATIFGVLGILLMLQPKKLIFLSPYPLVVPVQPSFCQKKDLNFENIQF